MKERGEERGKERGRGQAPHAPQPGATKAERERMGGVPMRGCLTEPLPSLSFSLPPFLPPSLSLSPPLSPSLSLPRSSLSRWVLGRAGGACAEGRGAGGG
eukprot:2688161-Rhodomonas_salina.1